MAVAGSMLTVRNTDLEGLVGLLRAQQDTKLDVVTQARNLSAVGGDLHLQGAREPLLTPEGVTLAETVLRPTGAAEGDIAAKLGIPGAYLRALRAEHMPLWDANVNGWLAHQPQRRFLVRGLVDRADGRGVARALLSDGYRFTDNLDVLMTVLAGIREAGARVEITRADLSDTRMYVKVHSLDIAVHAPALLANYTSPFTRARGADNPLVDAGFLISNSETGHGSFSITPQLTVQVCTNGMTMTEDVLREVHLGGRLRDGVVRWSADTQRAALGLVMRRARDAVATFLDRDYVAAKIAEIERDAGVPVTHPQETLTHVGTELRFTTAHQDIIMNHFIAGGDLTSGGVLQAVTSAAQHIEDIDAAYDIERHGIAAMRLAAAHARR